MTRTAQHAPTVRSGAPFDTSRLDELMAREGVDVILASSPFNVRYLLGGHYFWMKKFTGAMGLSQWIPFVGYAARRPTEAFYIGQGAEAWQNAVTPIWMDNVSLASMTYEDALRRTVAELAHLEVTAGTIAIEQNFLPAAAASMLRTALPNARFVEAGAILERQRAIKDPWELRRLREATDGIADAMLAVFEGVEVGATTREISRRLAEEEVKRGLDFDFCLITAGTSIVRAPSDDRWEQGDILSLDSGGFLDGFLGDIARMGVRGEPSAERQDILDEIESVQQATMAAVRAAVSGRSVVAAGTGALAACTRSDEMSLDIHGLGLVTHEVPRLMPLGSITPDHLDENLEAGMVLSIETTFQRPRFGFVKLEDTVVVTTDGVELLGDRGRGWNVV